MWFWMTMAWANPILLSGDRPPADLVDASQSRQGAVQVCLENDTSDVVIDVTVKANGKVSKLKGRGGTKSTQKCVIAELDGLEMSPREGNSTLKWTLTTRYLDDISSIGALGLVGAKGTQVGSGAMGESGGPIILGALPREHMDDVIDTARPLLQECMDAGRLDVPDLYGKTVLKFTVGAGGDVTQASVKSSTLGAPDVEACMVGHIKPLVFDRPNGGGIVIASYPFEFPRSQ